MEGIDTGRIHRAPLLKVIAGLETELAARDTTIAELREVLQKYGRHTPRCNRTWSDGSCTCGFSRALESEPT